MSSQPTARQPILGVRSDDVAPRVLVVGDPDRVELAAAALDVPVEVGRAREFRTVTGRYAGTPVTIASHGVGGAGAAVCFEELCRAGARLLLRAGTCGGLQPQVRSGDLVVATAAVRDDGVTDRLVPAGWPAVADASLALALQAAAAGSGLAVHTGVVHTTATFYPEPLAPEPGWRVQHRAGALAIEMELAVLLVVAGLHGARAAGILAVDGNLLTDAEDMSGYDPATPAVTLATSWALRTALEVLVTTAVEPAG